LIGAAGALTRADPLADIMTAGYATPAVARGGRASSRVPALRQDVAKPP
jgi:hypothetical protein